MDRRMEEQMDDTHMNKRRITVAISEEAFNRLGSFAIADNCGPGAIVDHLLMGRMLVEDGVATVPELSNLLNTRRVLSDSIEMLEEKPALGKCGACGVAFSPGEMCAMHADGTVWHEETQPTSMRTCRDGLLAKLAARKG